ncbi:hypothetical protein RHMOL_Rhmol04G0219000 [Rhododendron molle]|uniref:Uncharacterized protein n=1 Tax=Rhododendron molle TaxID=49168 RepID=A0ACC0P571_RHOML|nr:hypothetical protein RHMOL_Rhmol04G0219000 [Rhododendron molle]
MPLAEFARDDCKLCRIPKSGDRSRFTFYISGRTLRQLGTNQENRHFGRECFELPTFEDHNLQVYEYSWNNRELEGPLLDSVTWLESRYVKWLHKEVKARSGGYF